MDTETEPIQCPRCGNQLAMRIAGQYLIKHRRREILAPTVTLIRCEHCGGTWLPSRRESQPAA